MKILGEFQTTVRKALTEIDPNWETYNGLIICGTQRPKDQPESPEDLIAQITDARLQGLPFLGICFGHQLAAIEYARNILGMKDATSEEWGERGTNVVQKNESGMVVGHQGDGESYWHTYHVDKGIIELWNKAENFITVQYHPEYQSSKDKPHPILLKFLYHAKNS